MEYRIISADSHINEPHGTFVDRCPPTSRSGAGIVTTADGGKGWQYEGEGAAASGWTRPRRAAARCVRPSSTSPAA